MWHFPLAAAMGFPSMPHSSSRIQISVSLIISNNNFAGKEVAKFLSQVKVTMREAEIKLDETDFDEKKLINKKKKLILEGKDPEFIEKKLKRLRKVNRRKKLQRKLITKSRTDVGKWC